MVGMLVHLASTHEWFAGLLMQDLVVALDDAVRPHIVRPLLSAGRYLVDLRRPGVGGASCTPTAAATSDIVAALRSGRRAARPSQPGLARTWHRALIPKISLACTHVSCLVIAFVITSRRVIARASRHTRRSMLCMVQL
jgi:hypothetical protein